MIFWKEQSISRHLLLQVFGGFRIVFSSNAMASDAIFPSSAEVEDLEGSDNNDSFRMSCIAGHDCDCIHRDDRSTEKREILISWSLALKQYFSKVRFAVKWITNVFINRNKEDRLSSWSFKQCLACLQQNKKLNSPL
jgi:hypothetical protein